jgi:hypothetical protein
MIDFGYLDFSKPIQQFVSSNVAFICSIRKILLRFELWISHEFFIYGSTNLRFKAASVTATISVIILFLPLHIKS